LLPNAAFDSEKLWAFELGFRLRPHERLYATIEGFYNDWRDLVSTELVAPPFMETNPPEPTRLVFPLTFGNGIDGHSAGLEATVDVRPVGWWRVAGYYAWLRVWMSPKPNVVDLTQESRYEDGSPRHQVSLRNAFDLPQGVSVDWNLRYVSELADLDVPEYVTSDVRVAWRPNERFEVEAVGRNLHEAHHAEWAGDNGGAPVEIERSVYVGVTAWW
jgi:iron complex outermembrane receptor protein